MVKIQVSRFNEPREVSRAQAAAIIRDLRKRNFLPLLIHTLQYCGRAPETIIEVRHNVFDVCRLWWPRR